ncbi:hypothetical protein DLJ53_33705 [Acuticoccus sediminis]|uniref:Tandem-95 repeat protein n=1 Tax=Acuticoccus sediminis TaxID=2184697 RepID=A0A8B2NJS5_9HYPH|nr:Ig-like domain-containing protein [Acuticoccus sediminis]RAH95911.1 hypothetical protein DLJ53_33705 [Acuticoccus sediminis]
MSGDPVPVSDDFAAGTLDPVWRIEGPAGTSAAVGFAAADGFLELVTADGDHDVWGENNSARALQAMANVNFTVEACFLSTPTEAFQIQGILVEQDADTYLRFDTFSNGSTLYAYAAVIRDGVPAKKINVALSDPAPYLRVERQGDLWIFSTATDGNTWTEVGRFTAAITVTAAGPFAGNVGDADGFTARVDYVEFANDPIADEDGTYVPPPLPPVATDDAYDLLAEESITILVADLLANDRDGNDDALNLVGFTPPAHGTLVDNADGTLTYTPGPGPLQSDSFTYTVSDGTLTDSASVVLTAPPPVPVSDDFAAGTLDPVWRIEGPAGTSAAVGFAAADGFLELVTADGDHDVWGENNSARALQAMANVNFTVEACFLSTPTEAFQIQGILVEQDADTYLRFDTFSNGSTLYAYAAVIRDGVPAKKINVALSDPAPYLRVERQGDLWIFSTATDGNTWTEVGRFTAAITVTAAGPFAGNVGDADGFTARVDYVEFANDPIADEDGTYVPPPLPPVATDDAYTVQQDEALVIATIDGVLANDVDHNGDDLFASIATGPSKGTLTLSADGSFIYTPFAGSSGTDTFTYTVSDGNGGADTATATLLILNPVDVFSDDFSGGALSPGWSFKGIAGTAGLAEADGEGYLVIVSPAGVPVDAYNTLTTPRVVQQIDDGDFQVSIRLLNEPEVDNQEHGLLLIEDDQNWLRFDVAYTTPRGLVLIVGVIEDDDRSLPLFKRISPGEVTHLRVTRTDNTFVFETSGDGAAWTEVLSLVSDVAPSEIGPFAGSTSLDATPTPGFVSKIDWFQSSTAPIVDEDGDIISPVNTAPVAGNDVIPVAGSDPLVISIAGLLSNDADGNEDALSLVRFTQPGVGTLVNHGDGTLIYTPPQGTFHGDSFTYTVSDGTLTDTATVTLFDPINVWYGDTQRFGSPGEAQRWVNILGEVSGDIANLSYSLNGGPVEVLSIGPDTRRLHGAGEFNIEIDYEDLDGSATHDVVTIIAEYADGTLITENVTIDYEDGAVWSPNYTIDWDSVANIQDVAQIVDGTWTIADGGVRPVDTGYDRVIALGDASWDNYEVRLSVTTHDLTAIDPRGRDGGGFAVGALWTGHTDSPVSGWQPRAGWEPGAIFFYTDDDGNGVGEYRLHAANDFSPPLVRETALLEEGATYNIVMRVEQVGLYDRSYQVKIWQEGTHEPTGWTVEGIETFDLTEAPLTGGIYLNAHYHDVTFNDVSVSEIPGSDIVQGGTDADVLMAVDVSDFSPGLGEIDVFVTGDGADMVVLGANSVVYYDDGQSSTAGLDDYGLVWDFKPLSDNVRLAGNATDYLLVEDAADLAPGTAIWRDADDDEPELIGLLHNVYGLSLTDGTFIFDGLI